MEVRPSGLHIFKDVRTYVDTVTREFPLQGLQRNLKRVLNQGQIAVGQEWMKALATVQVEVNADLLLAPEQGSQMQNLFGQEHPHRMDEGLTYEQAVVNNAIIKTVGAGWDRVGRQIFDLLTKDGRRIAVISGDGRLEGEVPEEQKWFMSDEGGWHVDMEEVVSDIEQTGNYGLIVAGVKRTSRHGLPSPLTRGLPFFWLADETPRFYIPKR